MSTTTKVFLAAGAGSFLASWAEPKIVPKLPAQLQTGGMAKATHAAVAGASAALVYYGLGKLGVA
jgi:hypothetical protein